MKIVMDVLLSVGVGSYPIELAKKSRRFTAGAS